MSREALKIAAGSYDSGTVEPDIVDELVGFAFDCWPGADRLPIYGALRARQRMNPRALAAVQPFVVTPFVQKACAARSRRSWKYRGV